MREIKKLLWREYLRGFIDGGALGREYNLATLKAKYRRYMKLNPEVKQDIRNITLLTTK